MQADHRHVPEQQISFYIKRNYKSEVKSSQQGNLRGNFNFTFPQSSSSFICQINCNSAVCTVAVFISLPSNLTTKKQ